MDTTILEDLGLKNAEIKVYLALLDLGVAKAGEIIKKSGLQNSVVHATLAKLVEKGFINFIKKGGVREYTATDPKNILNFIDEKKKRFETLLPELLLKQKPKLKQEAEVYKGIKGLKMMLYELIKDAKKGDEFLFFAFNTENPDDYDEVYTFYREEYYNKRKAKGIKVKGLAPKTLKKKLSAATWYKKQVKFVDFPILTNISIFQDKVVFTPWEDEKISFMIHSKQLADSFKTYFNSIWNAKK